MNELLAEIADRGFLVNNLFQLDDGSWQCNLRSPDHLFTDWSRGPTPIIALSLALDAIATAFESQPASIECEASPLEFGVNPINLSQLLANLRPKSAPIFTQRLKL